MHVVCGLSLKNEGHSFKVSTFLNESHDEFNQGFLLSVKGFRHTYLPSNLPNSEGEYDISYGDLCEGVTVSVLGPDRCSPSIVT